MILISYLQRFQLLSKKGKSRTEGFEEILLSMQQITQQIQIGERCVVIVEYNPNAPFVKIQTAIE